MVRGGTNLSYDATSLAAWIECANGTATPARQSTLAQRDTIRAGNHYGGMILNALCSGINDDLVVNVQAKLIGPTNVNPTSDTANFYLGGNFSFVIEKYSHPVNTGFELGLVEVKTATAAPTCSEVCVNTDSTCISQCKELGSGRIPISKSLLVPNLDISNLGTDWVQSSSPITQTFTLYPRFSNGPVTFTDTITGYEYLPALGTSPLRPDLTHRGCIDLYYTPPLPDTRTDGRLSLEQAKTISFHRPIRTISISRSSGDLLYATSFASGKYAEDRPDCIDMFGYELKSWLTSTTGTVSSLARTSTAENLPWRKNEFSRALNLAVPSGAAGIVNFSADVYGADGTGFEALASEANLQVMRFSPDGGTTLRRALRTYPANSVFNLETKLGQDVVLATSDDIVTDSAGYFRVAASAQLTQRYGATDSGTVCTLTPVLQSGTGSPLVYASIARSPSVREHLRVPYLESAMHAEYVFSIPSAGTYRVQSMLKCNGNGPNAVTSRFDALNTGTWLFVEDWH